MNTQEVLDLSKGGPSKPLDRSNGMISVERDERSKRPPIWQTIQWVRCQFKCQPGKR